MTSAYLLCLLGRPACGPAFGGRDCTASFIQVCAVALYSFVNVAHTTCYGLGPSSWFQSFVERAILFRVAA